MRQSYEDARSPRLGDTTRGTGLGEAAAGAVAPRFDLAPSESAGEGAVVCCLNGAYEVISRKTCRYAPPSLITHVEVTPSSGSDTDVTVPLVDGLIERKVRPDELFADTAYGSGRNAFEAEGEGDGSLALTGRTPDRVPAATVAPLGHRSVEEYELEDASG